MRLPLLLALLALPVRLPAIPPEETGEAAQKAREKVDSLPVDVRLELKRMYRRYSDAVAKKLEAGWSYGVINEAVIEDIDEPFQPARLVEEMLTSRRAEVAKLDAAYVKARGEDPAGTKRLRLLLEAKRDELSALESSSRREKGLCRDWSDLVWHEFEGMELEHWEARDERRTARPYHTAAVACAPAGDPIVCLAFDPWEDGRPSVFSYNAWDERSGGGRLPADYFLHALPDPDKDAEPAAAKKKPRAEKK